MPSIDNFSLDNYGLDGGAGIVVAEPVRAGDDLILGTFTATYMATSTTFIKAKELRVNVSGTFRVRFELTSGAFGAEGVIYKNGVAFGTKRAISGSSTRSFSEDLPFDKGDLVQLYIRRIDANNGEATSKTFSVSIALPENILGSVII